MSQAFDIVIVGAGLAGLTAARALEMMQYSVAVVEARDRVGGRLLTQKHASGALLDLGGQWVGPGQERIGSLMAELGVEAFSTHDTGQTILNWNNRRKLYEGDIPKLGPLALTDFALTQSKLDRLARTVPLLQPWTAERAKELDSETFESWIRRHARTPSARKLFRLYATSVFAAEAHEMSALHVLFYTRSGQGSTKLGAVVHGAQERRIVGGTQQICEKIAEQLSTPVKLNTPVRSIEQDGAGALVQTDDQAIPAQQVVVAIPPTLSGRINYAPSLPSARTQLLQRVPAGSVIKAMAVYDTPFWRDMGLSGQVISDQGPVRIVFDNSPPNGEPGILLGFFEGADARVFSDASSETRRAAFIDCLVRYFGPQAENPVDYVDLDWSAEPWTGGCYGAHFPPGVWTAYGPALRRPFGRIHWAGTETALQWNGYMDGAVESGVRAADEIMTEL